MSLLLQARSVWISSGWVFLRMTISHKELEPFPQKFSWWIPIPGTKVYCSEIPARTRSVNWCGTHNLHASLETRFRLMNERMRPETVYWDASFASGCCCSGAKPARISDHADAKYFSFSPPEYSPGVCAQADGSDQTADPSHPLVRLPPKTPMHFQGGLEPFHTCRVENAFV